LMRIHWQIIKHVDGERDLGQISQLIGLSVAQLERPVRDLTVAGLIGVDNNRPVASKATSIKLPVSEPIQTNPASERATNNDAISSTSERKRSLFGMFSKATHDTNSGSTNSGSTNSSHSESKPSKPFTRERLLPPSRLDHGKADRNTTNPESITSESKRSSVRESKHPSSASTRRIDISSQYIDPEFIDFLRKRLAVFIGPMAEFALEDAADSLGVGLEKVRVEKLEHFIELLIQEVMPERQAEFHAQVGSLVQRYASRIGR
jgi:hypothetical protein